jgi:gas vesicle protein
MKSGKVVLGVLAGLAAGALLGILFAPDKGSVTRKRLIEKGDEYAEDIKEKFGDLVDDLSKKWQDTLNKRKEMVGAVESESREMNEG